MTTTKTTAASERRREREAARADLLARLGLMTEASLALLLNESVDTLRMRESAELPRFCTDAGGRMLFYIEGRGGVTEWLGRRRKRREPPAWAERKARARADAARQARADERGAARAFRPMMAAALDRLADAGAGR